MKQILSVLSLLICTFFSLSAQQSTFTASTATYFAPNAYDLDENARTEIDNFLSKHDLSQTAFVKLNAYTDDIGKFEENQELARKRAYMVFDYLLEKGLKEDDIHVNISGEVALASDGNIQSQRRENRKVVIQYQSKTDEIFDDAGEALSNYFEQQAQKAQQFFTFDAQKGTTINGAEGIVLQIPPDVFVLSDGSLAQGQLTLQLQEAHTYGAMFSQNLGTMANDKLLETGGMFKIRAQDKTGNPLAIRNGSALIAAMPNENAGAKNMQVFEGQHTSDGSVDWAATNRPVRNQNNNNITFKETEMGSFRKVEEHLERMEKTPAFHHKLPKYVAKPKLTERMPRKPYLRKNTLPAQETIAARYKQRNSENGSAYKHRIAAIYKKKLLKYKENKRSNDKKIAQFEKDSLRYEKAKSTYEIALRANMAYNVAMQEILEEMSLASGFGIDHYVENVGKMEDSFSGVVSYSEKLKVQLKNIEAEVEGYLSEGLDFEDLLAEIKATKLEVLSKKSCVQLEQTAKNCQRLVGSEEKYYKSEDVGKYKAYAARRIEAIYTRMDIGKPISPYYARQIEKVHEKLNEGINFRALSRTSSKIQKKAGKQNETIMGLAGMEESVNSLREELLRLRNEHGLLSASEVANTYGNAMEITTMGWINCDRFYESTSPKTKVEILANDNPNTVIFVLFEDIQSVMRATYEGDGKYTVSNIPCDEKVKVVGMRILGKSAEIFVESGKVGALKRLKPKFSRKTVEEATTLIQNI